MSLIRWTVGASPKMSVLESADLSHLTNKPEADSALI